MDYRNKKRNRIWNGNGDGAGNLNRNENGSGNGSGGVIVVKAPSKGFLVVKIIGILAAGFLILSLLAYFLIAASGGFGDPEDVEMVSWCEDDYVNRDYARLYDTLTLFDLYGDRYDLYWEAVEGYGLYIDVVQWSRAAQVEEAGATNSSNVVSDAEFEIETGEEGVLDATDDDKLGAEISKAEAPGVGKAAEMAREALAELRRLSENPEFPRNSDLLSELVQKAEAEIGTI